MHTFIIYKDSTYTYNLYKAKQDIYNYSYSTVLFE